MGTEKEIPAAALRYFSYRSELPCERMAWLYAYVIRKSREYPDLYRTYLPEMERFLAGCLREKMPEAKIFLWENKEKV